MKTVQKVNPGQPELPEWVYNGAMIGVQGGTDRWVLGLGLYSKIRSSESVQVIVFVGNRAFKVPLN